MKLQQNLNECEGCSTVMAVLHQSPVDGVLVDLCDACDPVVEYTHGEWLRATWRGTW